MTAKFCAARSCALFRVVVDVDADRCVLCGGDLHRDRRSEMHSRLDDIIDWTGVAP